MPKSSADLGQLTLRMLTHVAWMAIGAGVASGLWILSGAYEYSIIPTGTRLGMVANVLHWKTWVWLVSAFWVLSIGLFEGGVLWTQRWWKQNGSVYLKNVTRAKLQRLEYERDNYRELYQESHMALTECRKVLRAIDGARAIGMEDVEERKFG